jgi:hypothetical protein
MAPRRRIIFIPHGNGALWYGGTTVETARRRSRAFPNVVPCLWTGVFARDCEFTMEFAMQYHLASETLSRIANQGG